MYVCMYVPPLALGHLPRNEAAGHQIVTPWHSAWPWGRDVAPFPWYFLPWEWRVPLTVPRLPTGGSRTPHECRHGWEGLVGFNLQRRRKLPACANPASPCTTVTSPPSEGVKRCVTLWCGLHVPHCARPGLDMPLQRRRKLPAWGSPGWGYRQRCSCPRREFGVFHSPHGATCVASGSNGARLSFLAESSLGKAANWTRRRGLYSVSGPLSTLRPAGLRHPGHSPHAVPRLGTRPR
jgi:hypothetical protein